MPAKEPGVTDEELAECLGDWRWRFANLYWIKPEDKRPKILFNPKPEQWEILEAIYVRGEMKIAILKARQLGFSTLLALICLDMALFMAGFTIGIVDQTKDDAKKKLGKVMLAWENLPGDIKGSFKVESENKSEFSIRSGEDSVSTIYAGTNARGGTHQLLWISEWGPIQVEDAGRSDKIADGALPSSEQGITVVETTWRGGRTGRLYEEVVKTSENLPDEFRTLKDWKVYFFAWHLDPKYNFDGDSRQITEDCLDYFNKLKTDGVHLKDSQKLWYYKTAWVKGIKRFEEYPSTKAEMFDTPIDGAIYASNIILARSSGRVFPMDYDPAHPVHTTWDLGSPNNMVVLYWQLVGFTPRLIDCDHSMEMTTARRVEHMHSKGYAYGTHAIPHDGSKTEYDALSFKTKLIEAELKGDIKLIEREGFLAKEKRILIMLDMFSTIRFNETTLCTEGGFMDALVTYRYKKNPKDGKITDAIVDDWSNHFADAFGYFGEAWKKGLIGSLSFGAPNPMAEAHDSDMGLTSW